MTTLELLSPQPSCATLLHESEPQHRCEGSPSRARDFDSRLPPLSATSTPETNSASPRALFDYSSLSIAVRALLPELETLTPDFLRSPSQALLRPTLHLPRRCWMTLEPSSLQPSCATLLHESEPQYRRLGSSSRARDFDSRLSPLSVTSTPETNSASPEAL